MRSGWILALLALGCTKKQPGAIPLADQVAPGVTVALPQGIVDHGGALFENGRIKVQREADGVTAELRWNTTDAALTREEIEKTIRAATIALSNEDATLGPTVAVRACGHAGESYDLQLGKQYAGRLTAWWVAEEKRYFLLVTQGRDGARARALHQRSLASLRCRAVPVAERPKLTYPGFTPPEGFVAGAPQDGLKVYARGGEAFVFQAGQAGHMFEAGLIDTPDGNTKLRKGLTGVLATLAGIPLTETTDHTAIGVDGGKRYVLMGKADLDGSGVGLTLVYWHCARADLSFIAIHMAPIVVPGSNPGEQALMTATCP